MIENDIRIRKKLTDSNFIADIAIGTPEEDDYALFLSAHKSYQKELFGDSNFSEDEIGYIYRYNIPFKIRNMPILPATDINGWEFHHVEKVFIEISQFQPPTAILDEQMKDDLDIKRTKCAILDEQTKDDLNIKMNKMCNSGRRRMTWILNERNVQSWINGRLDLERNIAFRLFLNYVNLFLLI
ncbi:hypothetical protein C1646_765424 [Rhizophagus diaphanus]|nr:hypothetical protein C1646_765424 [Rhizophagus diaphanus] [Rhizophagus sp. MUCL 43196]